jgi:hypothetical protein
MLPPILLATQPYKRPPRPLLGFGDLLGWYPGFREHFTYIFQFIIKSTDEPPGEGVHRAGYEEKRMQSFCAFPASPIVSHTEGM